MRANEKAVKNRNKRIRLAAGNNSPPPNRPPTIDALMAFRLAYLCLIASYWRNPEEFKTRLKKENDKEFGHVKLLTDSCPGFTWTWRMHLELKTDKAIEFNRDGNVGWTGPPNHVTIYLPIKPQKIADHAEALAAYYAQFPTFLGGGILASVGSQMAVANPGQTSAKGVPAAAMGDGGDLVAFPAGVAGALSLGLSGMQEFLEFGAVVVRALALSWEEQARIEEIQQRIKNMTARKANATRKYKRGRAGGNSMSATIGQPPAPEIRNSLQRDGNAALVLFLGYCSPWNLKFKFKFVDVEYKPSHKENGVLIAGAWDKLPNSKLTLHLPEPLSKEDQKIAAVALAAYNNTGDAYPFSCGC